MKENVSRKRMSRRVCMRTLRHCVYKIANGLDGAENE